ncbi:hypothetical protein CWI36_0632p0010 [Hamiltosporidium magnivora]|uniref:Uncharacterized protein n=1 Tax=Hamiltosporidium magnivora TaxID=148818 RepID=A0A4Q9LCH8_9MICR|nr:hypothetical protein CWI36_0632p0010 [Hamiltosporidium magnivora]
MTYFVDKIYTVHAIKGSRYTRNISTAKQMSIQEEDVTYKTKNNSIFILVLGTTPEEPTFNISEESDLEEERMVVY